MIILVIHTLTQQDADRLLNGLFENHLIAHATLEKEMQIIKTENGNPIRQDRYMITAQTKAMLFQKIKDFITEHFDTSTTLFSQPMTQCNENLENLIKNNTQNIS